MRWALASVAIHVVAVTLLVLYSGPSFHTGQRSVRFLDLQAFAGTEPQVVELPAIGPVGGRTGGRTDARVEERSDTGPVTVQPEDSVVPPAGPPARPGGVAAGADPPEEGRRGVALRPSFESGRLWVRPMDALARVGGEGVAEDDGPIDNATHVAKVDSAVTAKLRAFLDTLPRDSFAIEPPPSWTTEINGQKWGVDQSWIYLGNLRLPAAVLALLPLPQGNFDESRRQAALLRIRRDILDAAWRAESAEQFRRNVRELRERKDREREERRNQVRPDTTRT